MNRYNHMIFIMLVLHQTQYAHSTQNSRIRTKLSRSASAPNVKLLSISQRAPLSQAALSQRPQPRKSICDYFSHILMVAGRYLFSRQS